MTHSWQEFQRKAQSFTLTGADVLAAYSAVDHAYARSLAVQDFNSKDAAHQAKLRKLAESAPVHPLRQSGIEASQPRGDL